MELIRREVNRRRFLERFEVHTLEAGGDVVVWWFRREEHGQFCRGLVQLAAFKALMQVVRDAEGRWGQAAQGRRQPQCSGTDKNSKSSESAAMARVWQFTRGLVRTPNDQRAGNGEYAEAARTIGCFEHARWVGAVPRRPLVRHKKRDRESGTSVRFTAISNEDSRGNSVERSPCVSSSVRCRQRIIPSGLARAHIPPVHLARLGQRFAPLTELLIRLLVGAHRVPAAPSVAGEPAVAAAIPHLGSSPTRFGPRGSLLWASHRVRRGSSRRTELRAGDGYRCEKSLGTSAARTRTEFEDVLDEEALVLQVNESPERARERIDALVSVSVGERVVV